MCAAKAKAKLELISHQGQNGVPSLSRWLGMTKRRMRPTCSTRNALEKVSSTWRSTSWTNTSVAPAPGALARAAMPAIAPILPGDSGVHPVGASTMMRSHSSSWNTGGSPRRARRHDAAAAAARLGWDVQAGSWRRAMSSSASVTRDSSPGCPALTEAIQAASSSRNTVRPPWLSAAHMALSRPRPNTRKLHGARRCSTRSDTPISAAVCCGVTFACTIACATAAGSFPHPASAAVAVADDVERQRKIWGWWLKMTTMKMGFGDEDKRPINLVLSYNSR
uniref:Uncharacterized protein n=1 Tax=Oryza glumipatula TaxID=40148 RepID=A0A0E0BQ71_9ORYZ